MDCPGSNEHKVNNHCRVNGAAIRSAGYEMHAAFAPATAADCVLQAAQGNAEVAVGSTSSFELRIADTKKLASRFSGSEDVTAFILGEALTTVPPEPCADSHRFACFAARLACSAQQRVCSS